MYRFRELFQSRFKTSISILDLYKMQDICNITTDKNDDKHISLNTELINSIENNALMEGLQESVPYCSIHFHKEQHKGWAEQEIEPLPNVFMTISEIRQIICPLLKSHTGDIPVASLVYCIAGELGIQINRNENGVNLEHLICCINGVQTSINNFGIKVLGWLVPENVVGKENSDRFIKNNSPSDPLYQISKEVIELIKMSPKSTMKFNRFIPAYHNHFGKQCRVADYGYTKLIELFEALSSVVQIMGDGENRQITLTHRIQIRRFTTDLLRIIRSQGNKSILLSQLPEIFAQTQNRIFDITDYGVCAIEDILDGLANSNIIVVTPIQNGNDILISIPKRKQTILEIEKTCVFAGEVVDLLCNAPQYSILFQKFVRSYHYHFGYQCRLSDYGFLKLADLMEAIQGVVEIEITNDEDKKIFLSPKVARRVFAEQLEELIKVNSGAPNTCMKLDDVLLFHKKKYGYQIQSQTLGFANIFDAIRELPYIEIIEIESQLWIVCHLNDANFRDQTYRICKIILNSEPNDISLNELLNLYYATYNEIITENSLLAMKYAIEIKMDKGTTLVILTRLMRYIMKVVKVIDQYKTLTLGEIKKYLSITLGDCFKIGYPNITSFIRAFPDIFNFELNSLVDRSNISLVSTCPLTSNSPVNNSVTTQVMHNIPLMKENILSNNNYNNIDNDNKNNNLICMKNFFENENENKYSNYINSYKFISTGDKNKLPSESTDDQYKYSVNYENEYHKRQFLQLQSDQQQPFIQSLYGKDNSFNVSLNSSNTSIDLNSTATNINLNKNVNSLSLSNGSANSVTSSCDGMNFSAEVNSTDINNNDPFGDFPQLWTNGNMDYFNDNLNYSKNDDIFGLSKITEKTKNIDNKSELNNKENVTDHSEIHSFWVDPIWGNNNKHSNLSHDQKNSTIEEDPAKFNLLELQAYNVIQPTLENSFQLSKTENMKKNMFSLDSSDEKTFLEQ
ncbi:meiosis regulator and mRNA stability factor 1-like [Condylostylus longicornis]|uniref:meiosis regulator and mRNA stability factor 1-like n=1 Tax=Condylostylus longicornis TaxID=2530218 RepID=UPI00244E275F|nr:meiosis regulator and mRNA stability factor 1-like [Condylostylus longicornis]